MSDKQVDCRVAEEYLSRTGKYYRRKLESNRLREIESREIRINESQEETTLEHLHFDNNTYNYVQFFDDNHREDPMDITDDDIEVADIFVPSSSDEDIIDDSRTEYDSDDYFSDHESCPNSESLSFKEELRQWYLRDPSVTHSACNSLLKILKKHIGKEHNLPSDIRTLVGKHEKIIPQNISGGESIYFGLHRCLDFICKNSIELPEIINFDINVDGAPIFDNPYISVSIWPILLVFKNIEGLENNVFPISIFCGSKKPDSLDFLDDFINEYNNMHDGFTVQNKTIKLNLELIRMDVPAHSFLCQTKSHSGYNACFKCEIQGEYYAHKVIYPYIDEEITRRTNEAFRAQAQEEHHIGESSLVRIPELDMIKQIPIDSMHCVHLGVMKKLLSIWFVTKPKSNKYLSNDCFKAVSESIKKLKGCLPSEFHRNLRSLDAINKYKAKELRMFLLYIGPFVLRNQLSKERFSHFLHLHTAVKILSDENHSRNNNMRIMAKRLINLFCIGMEQIYDKQYESYNLHLLTHLHEEVALNGPLDDFSNFIFENFLGYLKKQVKSPFKPLQQIANRNMEIFEYSVLEKKIKKTVFNREKQSIDINGVVLSCHYPNSIVTLSSSEVVRITKIENIHNKLYISGIVLQLEDYFKEPIRSSTIGCYLAKEDFGVTVKKELCLVHRKMVPFKINDFHYLVVPMTHNIR